MSYIVSILFIILLLALEVSSALPSEIVLSAQWLMCGCAVYLAYSAFKQKNQLFPIIFGIIALIFSPPFYSTLGATIRIAVDVAAAMFVFVFLFMLSPNREDTFIRQKYRRGFHHKFKMPISRHDFKERSLEIRQSLLDRK